MAEITTIDVVAVPVDDGIPQQQPELVQESKTSENPKQDSRPPLPMVHSILDEYGLDPYAFRIYSHIVRRTGGKLDRECFAKQKKMAEICRMSVRKAQLSLSVLLEAGFIEKDQRRGRTDIYKLTPMSRWKSKEELATVYKKIKPKKAKDDSENFELDF